MFEIFSSRRTRDNILSEKIDALVGAMTATRQEAPEPASTSERLSSIETDLQALQLRQEQLAEECLRHLRKASQRMKRAEDASADEEFEAPTNSAPVAPNFDGIADEPVDDHAWAIQQLRTRGEIPV
jgi:hypothetical protein